METNYKIWFDTENIYLQNVNGNVGYLPLKDYKPLLNASDEDRKQYEFSPFGIHWKNLDEDLCFDGFIWNKRYAFEVEQNIAAESEFEYKTKK